MPVLTDRQEPEDFDPNEPEDPNEYALRYLFFSNRPGVELQRSGTTLLYSGAATNILAFMFYASWLDFNFNPWLLLIGILVVFSGLGAAIALWKRHWQRSVYLAIVPLVLTLATLLYLLLAPPLAQAGFFFFFLPGSLVITASSFVIRAARREVTRLE